MSPGCWAHRVSSCRAGLAIVQNSQDPPIALAIATFACCNFAAFITRSGFFTAFTGYFNHSPLGWMFFLVLRPSLPLAAVSFCCGDGGRSRPKDRYQRSCRAKPGFGFSSSALVLFQAMLAFSGTLVAPLKAGFSAAARSSSKPRFTIPR